MDKTTTIVSGVALSCLLLIGGASYASVRSNRSQPAVAAIGQYVPVLTTGHIEPGAAHPPYNSNPPTSGQHYIQDVPWKVYTQELPDEALVHNLEHGGIWISYNPARVDQATISSLSAFTQSHPKVVLTPRAADDSPIALASWGRLAKQESFDEQNLTNFFALNRGHAPEPNAL